MSPVDPEQLSSQFVDTLNTTPVSPIKKYATHVLTTVILGAITYLGTGQWTFENKYVEGRDGRDKDMIRLLDANDKMLGAIHELDKEMAVLQIKIAVMHGSNPFSHPEPEPEPATVARTLPISIEDIKVPNRKLDTYQNTRGGK